MARTTKTRSNAAPRWTEEEAKAYLDRQPKAARPQVKVKASPAQAGPEDASPSLADALTAMGLGERVQPRRSRKKKVRLGEDGQPLDGAEMGGPGGDKAKGTTAKRATRRGVDTAPIFQSLNQAPAHSAWGADWLAVEIPGGRVLTYNELFSILQFRKHESFRYKKICRKVIERGLMASTTHPVARPFFDGPTRWTVVRIGSKDMDRDALSIVFKYFLDALKTQGVIADDNPNIIVDIQTVQDVGPPRLAVLLEKIPDWVKSEPPTWTDWVGRGQQPATAEALKAPRRKK